ncbi:hypothetical protein HUK65_15525 [Rhodobacteraceae bacterium 2376]|uniref:Uncharacterized protein n=1 Tax=Rhabdonatronobacter sediminivivens TaxID=2743469 RepID=A0A7Z0I1V2_9RHOB|nr:hypothetical protein [Rhabdonatronobacter sediminivivens]NYS26396.1 hypothetical protein [Rhabdonatronobacter sediminivivens]
MNIHTTLPVIFHPWNRLTEEERNRQLIRHAQRRGGFAVTLNMKPDFEERVRHAEVPMRMIGKRMNSEFNRHDLRRLPILMMLEATRPDGRLHLHGVYLANGLPKHRIHEAMRRAVGYVEGRSGSRQVMSKVITAADGWHNYIHKDCRWTRRLHALAADARLCWISHAMTATVRESYENKRLGKTPAANFVTAPLAHDA